ncbi:MAG: VCBS repeat-containing protein, partial [Pyrinomonadaceae bacterium]
MGLLAVALMAIGFISTTFARKATPPQGKLPQLSAPALAGSLAATVPRTPGNDKPVMKFGGKIVIEPGRTASISDPIAGQLLAAADFDNDGMPDLVCLQSGSFPSSKRLVMRFGNVDAIHPNADGARLRKANDTFTGLPFLSLAKNWTVPLSSKVVFVGAGDFDADGNSDVVITGQGEEQFLFLRGDGSGNLADPEKISIDGRVTAFATGEVNRYDGLMDIVVGAETKNGPKVLVFECPKGALRGMPEVIDITNAPTAIAIGQLDQEFPIDVAVANGSDLTIIWGRDRKLSLAPEIRTAVLPAIQKTVHQDAKLISVVIGAFDGDKVSDGIAISDEAGKVQVWGSINDEHRAEWRLPSSVVSGLSAIRLAAGRVTSLPQDSVLVNDTGTKQIQVLTLTGPEGSKFLEVQRMGGTNAAATVLPMKLNVDGLEDVLFASSANNEVASFLTLPGQVYFVSSIEGDNGNGTLPSAVAAANANPGLDTIVFNIPTNNGRAVIKIQTTLTITDPVVIDGTT